MSYTLLLSCVSQAKFSLLLTLNKPHQGCAFIRQQAYAVVTEVKLKPQGDEQGKDLSNRTENNDA